ncbi:MAG: transcription elongation factor GreA [Flavobacteriales bacterium]|nr:transcription elongation factor GreA [Flavobacteriales bacterium]
MAGLTYYTKEGLENLKNELHTNKAVDRPFISKQIADARDKGDLSENAEYHAAKEDQALLELKISKLEALMASARLIDESKLDTSSVVISSKVKIKNIDNGMEMTYSLVAEKEADFPKGKISIDSPIGKGLVGKKKGDKVAISVPSGAVMNFEILDISL